MDDTDRSGIQNERNMTLNDYIRGTCKRQEQYLNAVQSEWGDWLRKKRTKHFAFTLHVEMPSAGGGTTLTLLDMGGSAIGSTTIEAQETNDSWSRHLRAIVEEHLSFQMQNKRLELDDMDILPGPNADDYSVTVSLTPAEAQFREPRPASSSSGFKLQ